MLAEPGFQLSCLEYLQGGSTRDDALAAVAPPMQPTGSPKVFSFVNCKFNVLIMIPDCTCGKAKFFVVMLCVIFLNTDFFEKHLYYNPS